jgi:hypothetical protein
MIVSSHQHTQNLSKQTTPNHMSSKLKKQKKVNQL